MSAPPGQPDDAAQLIIRIAGGDQEAFSRFYDAFAGTAFRLIRRVLRDPAPAEEVLQEVFWQVWQDARLYDARRGSPLGWLLMRAKARAIDRLRSIRRREKTFVMPVDEARAPASDAGAGNRASALSTTPRSSAAPARLPAPASLAGARAS